ncbi:hypothetical protein AVEN_198268-1 [Araneus ventricosus]|uniref:Uncharacterized protein n=1 Tax=Araneus ventricosus TaxID=182803 RepID=A0A4Y2FCT8_ARAVE|nr:hypothetical protein AVEN_198268-1 [Araneus ventricosus]
MSHRDLIFDELQGFPHHFQDILRNSSFLLNHKLHGHNIIVTYNFGTFQCRILVNPLFHCFVIHIFRTVDESNTIGRVEKNAVFPHIPTAAICASFFGGDVLDNPIPVNRECTVSPFLFFVCDKCKRFFKKNFFQIEIGRDGLVVRFRLLSQRAPGSKPDSTENP